MTRNTCGIVRPTLEQHADDHRAGDHEQRVEDVVGGDDAGAVARLRAHLDQRVHRHAVEAGEEREQDQVGHHAPVRRLRRGRPPACSRPTAAGRATRSRGRSRTRSCRSRRAAPGRSRRGGATAPRTAASRCRCRPRTRPAAATRPARRRAAPPWRRTGTAARKTAPKNHIHEMPSSERKTTRLPCASLQVAPGLGDRVPVDAQARVGRRRRRHRLRRRARPSTATPMQAHGDVVRGRRRACATSRPPATLAEQDRDEGAHLDHAVAAGELALAQVLRQVGELDRAEQRRVQAHQEDAGEQHRRRRRSTKPHAGERHDRDLEPLDEADQRASCRTCRRAGRWSPRTAGTAG